jgi:hypothetical protein
MMMADDHRIVYESGFEAVCCCGTHLSIYGLTRSIASVFAQHIRNSKPNIFDGGPELEFWISVEGRLPVALSYTEREAQRIAETYPDIIIFYPEEV